MRALSTEFTKKFKDNLTRLLDGQRPQKIGVAVSGGGDSMALLHLLQPFAAAENIALHVVTVDHNLRAEAKAEAGFVAKTCSAYDIEHDVLEWDHPSLAGNLQARAREARYDLISQWADQRGVACVLTGHTADDQAETFLLRLARGSGVDGLAGMAEARLVLNVQWLRPLLTFQRQDLRRYLIEIGATWIDDPSNLDDRFDRVKIRKAMPELASLGLDLERLTDTSDHLRRAAVALQEITANLAQSAATLTPEAAVEVDRKILDAAPEEIRTRLVAAIIRLLGQTDYKPRYGSLVRALSANTPTTLNGTLVNAGPKILRISREPAAALAATFKPSMLWDNRWAISGPEVSEPAEIRPVDRATLQIIAKLRDARRDPASLLGCPAIWQNDALLAVPSAGIRNSWDAKLIWSHQNLISSILTH